MSEMTREQAAADVINHHARVIRADTTTPLPILRLVEMIAAQQQLLDYALAEIERLQAANAAREGEL